MKKFFVGFLVASFLVCNFGVSYSAPLSQKKRPINPIVWRYGIVPGDVLVVEMPMNNKPTIVLVTVNADYSMDYFMNGRICPFQVADLEVYRWTFYIKN